VSYVEAREWMERARAVEAENERLRDALAQTIDLCNAMREYAPTLNMDAERTLRDALRVATWTA
jgi:hypothetical protein